MIEAGYQIDFVSPQGGGIPLDCVDRLDEEGRVLLASSRFKNKIKNTIRPEEVDSSKYRAIYFAGGRGAKHTEKPNFQKHTVVSDRMITGQNPAGAKDVAEKIVSLLKRARLK